MTDPPFRALLMPQRPEQKTHQLGCFLLLEVPPPFQLYRRSVLGL